MLSTPRGLSLPALMTRIDNMFTLQNLRSSPTATSSTTTTCQQARASTWVDQRQHELKPYGAALDPLQHDANRTASDVIAIAQPPLSDQIAASANVDISLPRNGLKGHLYQPRLVYFTKLSKFTVEGNRDLRTIPTEIGMLRKLSFFTLPVRGSRNYDDADN